MFQPHIQVSKENGVQLVFPIDSSGRDKLTRVFAPQYSINITPPGIKNNDMVHVEIFKAVSPSQSFTLFSRQVFLPELDSLDVLNAKVILGKETRIVFPQI